MARKSFDSFISHASEDKESFVEPLANGLKKLGLKIWYDRFELKVGDSLRESIEAGLAGSKYGIVVFSPSFFKKRWTRQELNGLFSREMSGKKNRILPILHGVRISELTRRYPIQADRFCLSSTMEMSELCRQLVDKIRPELLTLDNLKARSLESASALIESLKRGSPTYGFSVSVASDADGKVQQKIQISKGADDAPPISLGITFVGEGIKKAQDLIRTGKPQTWVDGEIAKITSDLPLFPNMVGGLLSAGPATELPERPVRVECGESVFPYMLLKQIRGGTDEIEFEVSSPSEPLGIQFVFPLVPDKESFSMTLKFRIAGFRASRCKTMVDFVDSVMRNEDIRIIDLKDERPTLRLPRDPSEILPDPFLPKTRRLIELCSALENRFSSRILIGESLSDDDVESLRVLDGLLNRTNAMYSIKASFTISKGANPDLDDHICFGRPVTLRVYSPAENFPGYFVIFGIKISVPPWGLSSQLELQISTEDRKKYCAAQDGFETEVIFIGIGPAKYIWESQQNDPLS